MNRKNLMICVGVGVLAASAYQSYRNRSRRHGACSPAAPQHIQTWESEGGGVPVGPGRTAGQLPTPPLPGEEEAQLRAALALSPLSPSLPPW